MSTRLHLKCDGCDAETHSEIYRKYFSSYSGRSHGLGQWVVPDVDAVLAAQRPGWVWSDPYTSCTYCPDCWKSVEGAEVA